MTKPEEVCTITYGQLNDLCIALYKAGFMASAQGWNGEYPFNFRDPQSSQKWINECKANATRIIKETLNK